MAGTINLSLSQQFDNLGRPLADGRLYFFKAGTSEPQTAYANSILTVAHPHPIILDAAGRVPQLFFDDGLVKVRLLSNEGVPQFQADNVPVLGSSNGTGGGGSDVDETAIYQTGDLKPRYGTGTHSGWVRANGRTIGDAGSGATERANADTQSLFIHLWTVDSNLSVSGGRGSSALSDFNAGKTIALPDLRGRTLAGMDNMGASAAGRLSSTYFGTSATVLGAAGGSDRQTLSQANLPNVNLTAASNGNHSHFLANVSTGNTTLGTGSEVLRVLSPDDVISTTTDGAHTHTVPLGGSNTAHNNVQPTMVVTIYIKL